MFIYNTTSCVQQRSFFVAGPTPRRLLIAGTSDACQFKMGQCHMNPIARWMLLDSSSPAVMAQLPW